MNPALKLALSYAAAGYDVLPLHGIAEPAPADVVEQWRAGKLGKKEAQARAVCTCGARPCSSPGKHPRLASIDEATRDAKRITLWFQNPKVPTNVGIRLPPGQLAIDFDLYVKGVAEKLDGMRVRGLPETLTQESGRVHLIYTDPRGDGGGYGSKFGGANGIDIIHHGHRYLVAAPSQHWTGSRYRWVSDADPAPALEWIAAEAARGARGYADARAASAPRADADPRGLMCPLDVKPAEWAVTLAREILPVAIEDGHPESVEHGHATLAKAACHLVAGCELSETEALELLWEHYNPRCVPPWGEDEYEDFERCVMTAGAHATPGYLNPSETTRAMYERAKVRHERMAKAPEQPRTRLEQPPEGEGWGKLPLRIIDPSEEAKPLTYHWGPFAPGKVSAIIGYAYNAKTPFAVGLSLSSAAGQGSWCGIPITGARRTLHVVFEGALNARRKALRMARGMGGTLETVRGDFDFGVMPSASLMPADAEELAERAHAQGYGLLVLDTYGSALASDIDRNAAEISDALKAMGDVSDRTGLIVVVLLHVNKSVKPGSSLLQAIDGHNSIAGALQAAVALTRPSPADEFLFELTCERAPEEGFKPIRFRWRDVPEPVRSMGARISAAAREGNAEDPAKWGLVAELDGASSETREDAAHALAVDVLAWFEAHRSNGHAADLRELVEALGKVSHSSTNGRVRGALLALVEAGRLGCDRAATARGARFGLLGRKHSHAEGLVTLAGEIAGGYDVTEGAARMRAERALRQ